MGAGEGRRSPRSPTAGRRSHQPSPLLGGVWGGHPSVGPIPQSLGLFGGWGGSRERGWVGGGFPRTSRGGVYRHGGQWGPIPGAGGVGGARGRFLVQGLNQPFPRHPHRGWGPPLPPAFEGCGVGSPAGLRPAVGGGGRIRPRQLPRPLPAPPTPPLRVRSSPGGWGARSRSLPQAGQPRPPASPPPSPGYLSRRPRSVPPTPPSSRPRRDGRPRAPTRRRRSR